MSQPIHESVRNRFRLTRSLCSGSCWAPVISGLNPRPPSSLLIRPMHQRPPRTKSQRTLSFSLCSVLFSSLIHNVLCPHSPLLHPQNMGDCGFQAATHHLHTRPALYLHGISPPALLRNSRCPYTRRVLLLLLRFSCRLWPTYCCGPWKCWLFLMIMVLVKRIKHFTGKKKLLPECRANFGSPLG